MTWYTFFKSVHVVAAALWVGGAAMIQALALRIVRTGDARRQADFAKDTEIVGMRLFIPTTWILLLAGIAMMINLDWSWGQNWIVGPEGGRIAAVIEREGPASPEVQARIRRILTVSRCELVILVTVIVNMVVKPTGNAGWFWGLLIAMLAGIGLVLANYLRGAQPVAAPATE
jgi:hypothetical protein